MASKTAKETEQTINNIKGNNSKEEHSKPPSKTIRDRLRMLSFRRKKKDLPVKTAPEKVKVTETSTFSYESVEYDMRLTRLEEPKLLTTALRHLIRTSHPKGGYITFPVPEAVDRIQLKCACLPTDAVQLKELTERVFQRREETLDLENLYNDFVKTHGRNTHDFTQKWPMSHIHTRHP